MDQGRAGLIIPSVQAPWTTFHASKEASFRFEDEEHLYWLREQTRWSCTGMLKAVGYVDDRFYTAESAENGRRRHKATQIVDQFGAHKMSAIAQEDVPYVEAWEKFVKDWNFRPRLIETPMYHPAFLFGVTADREGFTDHPDGLWKDEPSIGEIKTGMMPWWTKFQTAIQDITLQAWDIAATFRRRLGVQLKADGNYNVEIFDDPTDYEIARCVAAVCMANESKLWRDMRDTGYFASAEFI